MATISVTSRVARHICHMRMISGLLALLAMVAFGMPSQANPEDQKCLACHQSAMEKPLPSGETLSLQVHGDKFDKSVHAMFGCAACHSDVDLAKHPGASAPIESKRAFSVKRSEVCATCHTDQATQWAQGVHAALVKEGNPLAPVCTSCHNPHAVMKGAAQAMDTVPCKTCHTDIFDAYATSVHGTLRGAGINQAPLCFSCHGAHEIKVPTANAGIKDTCFSCHKDAAAKHADWLPNTQLHFKAVACVACHSPKAHRKVDLILFDSRTKEDTSRPTGVPAFESNSSGGLPAASLFSVLQSLNKDGNANKTAIRGRLVVSNGVEAHQLTPASEAIRNCATCHKAGSEAFQSVSVSVAGPGGIPVKYDVSKDALHSVLSLNAIGGFYAIGGTRIALLDVLLVLALLAGIGIPMLHLGIRWLSHRPSDDTDKNSKER